jgi:hypothetical protein
MLPPVGKFLRKLLCFRHVYRQSTSWPDVIVCIRCGHRKAGVVAGAPPRHKAS